MKKRFTDRLLKIGNRSILAALAAIGFPAYGQLSKPVIPSVPIPPKDSLYKRIEPRNVERSQADTWSDEYGVALYGCPGVNSSYLSTYFFSRSITGIIFEVNTRTPIRGASVDLIYKGKILATRNSDENGKFEFKEITGIEKYMNLFIRVTPTNSFNGRKYKQAEKAVIESNIFIGLEREN